jgi:hypothetical protein
MTGIEAYAHLRQEDNLNSMDASYIGKLIKLCPSLYDSLSAWERLTLEKLVREDLSSQVIGGGKPALDSSQLNLSPSTRPETPMDLVSLQELILFYMTLWKGRTPSLSRVVLSRP